MRRGNARFGKRSSGYQNMLYEIILGAFSGGAPGWLYDDSRMDTLYQDSAGTTPVTALEQPVGLQLDLSQGLVLGSELITPAANRDFSSNTGYWSLNTNVTIANNALTFIASGNTFGASHNSICTPGSVYQITYTIGTLSSGGFQIECGGNVTQVRSAVGTYVETILCGSTGSGRIYPWSVGASTTGTITSISVKKLAGNHRYQPTSANRPTWSARYNLLTKTEQFDNAAWSKSGTAGGSAPVVTADQTIAPDGTLTADKVVFAAPTSGDRSTLSQAFTSTTGFSYKGGLYAMAFAAGDIGKTIIFRQAGAAGYTSITLTAAWQRVLSTETSAGGGFEIALRPDSGSSSGTVSCYLWGADARSADQSNTLIPTYQRVNTSTDYAGPEAGFPAGLRWNGSNSWMQNASVDFSGTNKVSVFVGVRKQSDAAFAILSELSTTVANAGTFSLYAPNSAGTYVFALNGTALSGQTATTFTAPITNVLSVAYDISQSTAALETIPKVNGITPTLALFGAASAGTGNFIAAPTYFGARAGSSAFFNGLTFSNIAIGIALSASQIAAFESWSNARARAY